MAQGVVAPVAEQNDVGAVVLRSGDVTRDEIHVVVAVHVGRGEAEDVRPGVADEKAELREARGLERAIAVAEVEEDVPSVIDVPLPPVRPRTKSVCPSPLKSAAARPYASLKDMLIRRPDPRRYRRRCR
jgi:hypothetical protein